MSDYRNPDGTYNGVKIMAELSGLSEDEIRWTWARAMELKAKGMSKDVVKTILREEGKQKPWMK